MSTTDKQKLLLVIAMLLALVLLGLAIYLATFSLIGQPIAGCGEGSGCGEVLASKWSRVGPMPVSILAGLTYLAMLVGLVMILRSDSGAGATLLLIAAPTLPIAGFWFTYLQRVEIGAICPFCMVTHGLGFVLFCLTCFIEISRSLTKPIPPLAIGVVLGGLLIPLQLYATEAPPIQRAPNPFADQDGDTWIDDVRYVSLFGGELQFVLQDVPYIGDPTADHVVAVVFDYACPYCRTLHIMLDEAIEQDPSRFVLVPIPVSIWESHNPYIGSDDQRFEHSFERAIVSMAVGAVDREKWKQLDRWMFNSDGSGSLPSDHVQLRVKAELLIGNAVLNDQLTGENLAKHEAELKRNIELLRLLPEDKRFIPVTTTPGAPEHLTTRFDDIEVLYELLESAKTTE